MTLGTRHVRETVEHSGEMLDVAVQERGGLNPVTCGKCRIVMSQAGAESLQGDHGSAELVQDDAQAVVLGLIGGHQPFAQVTLLIGCLPLGERFRVRRDGGFLPPFRE